LSGMSALGKSKRIGRKKERWYMEGEGVRRTKKKKKKKGKIGMVQGKGSGHFQKRESKNMFPVSFCP